MRNMLINKKKTNNFIYFSLLNNYPCKITTIMKYLKTDFATSNNAIRTNFVQKSL